MLVSLFKQQGLNIKKDATEVHLGNVTPAAGLAALSSGRIDALSFPAPAGQEAEEQGIGDIFISPVLGDVPSMEEMVYSVLFTRQSVINAKPKAVQAFVKAMAQAEAFLYKNPAQTTTLLGKYLHLDQKTTRAIATSEPSREWLGIAFFDHDHQLLG